METSSIFYFQKSERLPSNIDPAEYTVYTFHCTDFPNLLLAPSWVGKCRSCIRKSIEQFCLLEFFGLHVLNIGNIDCSTRPENVA